MKHSYLTSILDYNPETGIFVWKAPRSKVNVGNFAGHVKKGKKPYVRIMIDGKDYSAHRLAWFYVHGFWPKEHIDHINGNHSDNRIANLREATRSQNRTNSKNCNKTGLKGVRMRKYIKDGGRNWEAQITFNKKTTYLGCYHTKEEAHTAYCDAARRLHGDFFNPG